MVSLFIGVYRAMYDYQARDELELTMSAGDLLYLLEKSDIDEWWTVKKRVAPDAGPEVEEVQGIVPSNYIEPATPLHTCHAMFDYNKQTQEELSFQEGTRFDVYDTSDPDWLLVGVLNGTQYGYVPANYIEKDTAAAPGVAAATPTAAAVAPVTVFAKPPQQPEEAIDVEGTNPGKERPQGASTAVETLDRHAATASSVEDEDTPPPMPARPNGATEGPDAARRESSTQQQDACHYVDDEYFRWFISELQHKKKTPVELAVSPQEIIFKRDPSSKLKSGEELQYTWPIERLTNYNHEKKHLFLDFEGPVKSLHLYTGDKLVSEAIIAVLGEYKGTFEARGLREIARASSLLASLALKPVGTVLFRFKSKGPNELLADAGEKVYVLESNKDKDWWLCKLMLKKKSKGYIPASYIELHSTSKQRLLDERSERDKLRERDKARRGKQLHVENDDSMPNSHRVRTWIDNSGSFKLEAEFLGFREGKVHLHKTNGVKIAVAAAKLSIEDLEYVEMVTETSLQEYKDEVARQAAKRARKQAARPSVPLKDVDRSGVVRNKSATALINDLSSKTPTPSQTRLLPQSEPHYDWFEFFLKCGVDPNNCQRYSVVFSKEQMDESVLEDITPTLLCSLGLREGDILRVVKHLDSRFDRRKLDAEPSGELKINSSVESTKVNASALPSSASAEDDAWAIKPAARSSEDASKSPPATRPQYTGSLHDLIDIKPAQAASTLKASITLSLPALEPTKTAGLIPVQPTGFVPIVVQPTGFVPIQVTGALMPQTTLGIVPLHTGATTFPPQITGPVLPSVPPPTTFGQALQPTGTFVPLQPSNITGPLAMPATTFTMTSTPAMTTGQNMGAQATCGAVGSQATGMMAKAFVPQSAFGKQITGGFMAANRTGGAPIPSFGTQTGGDSNPFRAVPQQPQPQPQVDHMANMFQNTYIGQPHGNFGQQPNFEQQPTFAQPHTTFGQQQTTFGQPAKQMWQQPQFGQSPAAPVSFGQPTLGQPSFDGFLNVPLQSQPTGLGFGNAPGLTSQSTGRRANLATATPDNPFGF